MSNFRTTCARTPVYGYRYYDPVTGRWVSRDPIGESGGINVFVSLGNDLLNDFDYLGMKAVGPTRGKSLSKLEACALSGAINIWLDLSGLAFGALEVYPPLRGLSGIPEFWGGNRLFDTRIGAGEISRQFLKRYMSRTGKEMWVSPYLLRSLDPDTMERLDSQARAYFWKSGFDSKNTLKMSDRFATGDLMFSIHRFDVYYNIERQDEGFLTGSIFARLEDEYNFHDEKLDVYFPHFDFPAWSAGWKGGSTVDDIWMKSLEDFGYAKRFPVFSEWRTPLIKGSVEVFPSGDDPRIE